MEIIKVKMMAIEVKEHRSRLRITGINTEDQRVILDELK